MRRAVCPGSYDPVTLGHLDVVRRAAAVFDDVVVAVMHNPAKSGTFPVEQRIALLEDGLDGVLGVRVAPFGARLLVDVCAEVEAHAVVKGVRTAADVDYELPMALMNRHLSGVETVFLPGDPAYAHISSSLVREIVMLGGDISGLVTTAVAQALRARLGGR